MPFQICRQARFRAVAQQMHAVLAARWHDERRAGWITDQKFQLDGAALADSGRAKSRGVRMGRPSTWLTSMPRFRPEAAAGVFASTSQTITASSPTRRFRARADRLPGTLRHNRPARRARRRTDRYDFPPSHGDFVEHDFFDLNGCALRITPSRATASTGRRPTSRYNPSASRIGRPLTDVTRSPSQQSLNARAGVPLST